MPMQDRSKTTLIQPATLADPSDPAVALALEDLDSAFADDLTLTAVETATTEHKAALSAKRIPVADRPPPANFQDNWMLVIDQMLANPGATYGQLAETTGYSRMWLSKISKSDAFIDMFRKRQMALVDPIILESIQNRLRGVNDLAIDILGEKLQKTPTLDNALAVFKETAKALGMGLPQNNAPTIQQSFVVRLPEKSLSAEQWAEAYAAKPIAYKTAAESGGMVIEATSSSETSPSPFSAISDITLTTTASAEGT